MSAVLDFLFSSAAFSPHGYCLAWRPDLVALHVTSDLLITGAYLSIPAALHWFIRRRRDIEYRWVVVLFMSFITACGLTHLFGAVTLWEPVYGLQGVVKGATALISVATAAVLWPVARQALALPGPSQFSAVNAQLRSLNEELEARVAARTAELETVNRRLEALIDTAVDGIVLINDRGTILRYNRACERLFGYAPDETVGSNVRMLMPQPYRGEHDDYLAHHRDTGERRIIGIGREVTGQHKDGSTFPMELSVGEALAGAERTFVGIIRDITERKESEARLAARTAELETANRRLEALIDTAVDGIVLIDERGTILRYNPACERLFGYAPEETVGSNVRMLMPQPYRGEHDDYLAHYRDTGERRIIGIGREVTGQHKDGSTFPMELSVGEALAGGERSFVGIIRDITERKAAERRLLEMTAQVTESRGFLAAILDNANAAIFVKDRNGRYLLTNPMWRRMRGLAEDLEPQGSTVFDLFSDELASEIAARDRAVLESGEPISQLEQHTIGGIERAYMTHRFAVRNEAGTVEAVGGIATDVTEQRLLEQALRLANDELRRSNADLEQYASVISHDLQAPLRTIVGFCGFVLEDHGDKLSEEAQDFLRRSIQAAQRLQQLNQALLDYARLGADRQRGLRVDCGEVLHDAIENLSEAVRQAGATIEKGNLPVVSGVRPHLTSLFQNLLDNAIKYRSDEPPAIGVSAERLDGKWCISVRDNGIGIDPQQAHRAFQIFRRLHRDSTQPGRGIGLAFCKRIVEQHGGKIWIEKPEDGRGTVIRFTLSAE